MNTKRPSPYRYTPPTFATSGGVTATLFQLALTVPLLARSFLLEKIIVLNIQGFIMDLSQESERVSSQICSDEIVSPSAL